ncbi:hypothetical protein [Spirosoma sp.]|uniref:hypothetical protein n=1 Tax=Spirosoma sp. TaxID=1899569 RepID=UPI003B3BC9FB
MKTSRLLTTCVAMSVLLGATMSCDQKITELAQPASTPTAAPGNEKISRLLERTLREGTQEEYDAITAEYKALSFDELELFNKVKTEIDQERLVQKLAQSGVKLNQTQRQMVTGSLQQANSLRSAVNRQSVALYGVPYNQLADSLLYSLLERESVKHPIDVPNFNPEPSANARAAQVMACTAADFPYVSTKLSGNRNWNYWGWKRTTGSNDCDIEFRYSGYLFRFYPKDWFAERLCDSFNNRILRRSNNTYTRLLMGAWRVIFWEGDPGLTSVDMRS